MTYTYYCSSIAPDRLRMAIMWTELVCYQHSITILPSFTTHFVENTTDGNVYIMENEITLQHKKEKYKLIMNEWFYSYSNGPINDATRGTVKVCIHPDDDAPEFVHNMLRILDNMLEYHYNERENEYRSTYYWENPSYFEYSDIDNDSGMIANRKLPVIM